MLLCFPGSLVSHCPVFPPWRPSRWPLFGDILPQEPCLTLPSPSPSPRQLLQTHSGGENTDPNPPVWDPRPQSHGPFIPPASIQRLSGRRRLGGGGRKGPVSLLRGGGPARQEREAPQAWQGLGRGSPKTLGRPRPEPGPEGRRGVSRQERHSGQRAEHVRACGDGHGWRGTGGEGRRQGREGTLRPLQGPQGTRPSFRGRTDGRRRHWGLWARKEGATFGFWVDGSSGRGGGSEGLALRRIL